MKYCISSMCEFILGLPQGFAIMSMHSTVGLECRIFVGGRTSAILNLRRVVVVVVD